MTVVNITALETLLGAPGPISTGVITARYWAGGTGYIGVTGADVTFPQPISVQIVDGEPATTVDLTPTGDVCCVKWTVASFTGHLLTRYTSIPDTGPVDFGDLTVVDPRSFAPNPGPPSLLALIDERIALYMETNPLYPSDGE